MRRFIDLRRLTVGVMAVMLVVGLTGVATARSSGGCPGDNRPTTSSRSFLLIEVDSTNDPKATTADRNGDGYVCRAYHPMVRVSEGLKYWWLVPFYVDNLF